MAADETTGAPLGKEEEEEVGGGDGASQGHTTANPQYASPASNR